MIKAVIFDLDGTLLNTLEDLCDSVNFALLKQNYPPRTIEEIRQFVGNGVNKLIERALPAKTEPKNFQICLEDFKSKYTEIMLNKTKPYDGIIEMLTELKLSGIKTAILSNKFDAATKKLCNYYFALHKDFL